MITLTTSSKLSVKELAPVLGKSVGYFYKARMVGLPMFWDIESHCLVGNPDEIRSWVKQNCFKIVDGKPKRVKKK
jgi:hypothetical protein